MCRLCKSAMTASICACVATLPLSEFNRQSERVSMKALKLPQLPSAAPMSSTSVRPAPLRTRSPAPFAGPPLPVLRRSKLSVPPE